LDILSNLPPGNIMLQILAQAREGTVVYTSRDLHIGFINDAMLRIWHKDDSVTSKPLAEVAPEFAEFFPILNRVWENNEIYTATDTLANINVNGVLTPTYFDFEYRPVQDADGKTYAIINTATDVTTRVLAWQLVHEKEAQAEVLNEELAATNEELASTNEELITINEEYQSTNEELVETQHHLQYLYDHLALSETLFRNIFEQSPVGMAWFMGPAMIIEQVNTPILKIWGRTTEELIGRPHRDARPEMEGQGIFEQLEKVYHTGQTVTNTEVKVKVKDGDGLREAYLNSVYTPVKDNDDQITGVLVILNEVTEKLLERRRRDVVEEQFRLTVESAQMGSWYLDTHSRQLTATSRVKELFGFYPDDDLSLDDAIIQIRDDYRDRIIETFNAAVASGQQYDVEFPTLGYHDGKLRWVRAFGKLYPSEMGDAPQFSGLLMEITESKEDETRKNDFVAMVSHELKTPLTSAKAFVQMLAQKAVKSGDNFTEASLQKVDRQIDKMQTLIKGFLDIARMEAGKINLDRQHFIMADLVKECVEENRLFSQKHQIIISPFEPVQVYADRDKIEQVINNFLSNAVKYSPNGKLITVSSFVTDDGLLQVNVTDEGIGINPQDKARLFDRFYRVESKHTKTISGFGIGLYLCAEIIQLHGGQVGIESEIGQGSTFYFKLPIDDIGKGE
jgi:two-component system sensor histidine kinase VicK